MRSVPTSEGETTTDTQPAETEPEPSTDSAPAPASSAEPRAQRVGRYVHRARLYSGAVAFVALLVVLIILISANTRTVKLSWAFGSARISLVWIVLVAVVAGWLLGLATSTTFWMRTRRST